MRGSRELELYFYPSAGFLFLFFKPTTAVAAATTTTAAVVATAAAISDIDIYDKLEYGLPSGKARQW